MGEKSHAHRGRKNADDQLLQLLACGATVEQAAQQAGVSARTAHRRLKDPSFQQRLQAARSDMVQRTSGMLTAAAMEAVKTLLTLQHAEIPAAVRLGAARAVLELGLKLREVSNLTERIEALEAQMRSES
jgi:hypothetical protein